METTKWLWILPILQKNGISSHKMHGISSNKKVIIPIASTIRSQGLAKVEMVQSSSTYTFIHFSKSQITKK